MPDTTKRDDTLPAPTRQESQRIQKADPSALARLFSEWMQGDAAEQRETFEALRRSLNEARPAGHKLFW
jgi:hypothetical protein